MFMNNIDILSKIYYDDVNYDYTVGSLYNLLVKLKDEEIVIAMDSMRIEMFDSK